MSTSLGQKIESVERGGIAQVHQRWTVIGMVKQRIGHLSIACELHPQKQAQLEVGAFKPQPGVYQNEPSSLCA